MNARDNGLRANSYEVLVEVEESLGDRLLDALAARQIAAYVVPARGPGGATRLILHVDSQRRIPAGIVLAGLTPAPAGELPVDPDAAAEHASRSASSFADDEAFAEIVAGFYRTPSVQSWPVAEDLPLDQPFPPYASPGRTVTPPGPPSPPRRAPYTGVERRRGSRSADPYKAAEPALGADDAPTMDDGDSGEEHYAPPPLDKLPPTPRHLRLAFLLLGIGLALLLVPTFLTLEHQTSLDVLGVISLLCGTALIVVRLRERSPDDPDNGAVV